MKCPHCLGVMSYGDEFIRGKCNNCFEMDRTCTECGDKVELGKLYFILGIGAGHKEEVARQKRWSSGDPLADINKWKKIVSERSNVLPLIPREIKIKPELYKQLLKENNAGMISSNSSSLSNYLGIPLIVDNEFKGSYEFVY